MISPHFAKMEEKYPGVKLVKVDVEEQEVCSFCLLTMRLELTIQQIAQEQGIKAMPTFIAYKKGEKIETITGAVPAKITVSHSSC